jgi:MarR family transcriptional regulator for hemolysin
MSEAEKTLGFLLHDVARLLRKRFEQNAGDLGLTRSQWQVLAILAKSEGIQQGALAEMMEIQPITLVRILDRLEQEGLIERRPHATDRRVWQLFLGPDVHPILEEMKKIGARTRAEALQGLSPADHKHLMDMLSVMKRNLVAVSSEAKQERSASHG